MNDTTWNRWFQIGTLAGLAVCMVLVWKLMTGEALAGCGGGSCDAVLSSRWARVFHVPVAWLAALFYVVWAACEWAGAVRVRVWCGALAAGAAVWFILVQAWMLKSFCPWCMTVHGVGLGLFLLALVRAAGLRRRAAGVMCAALAGLAAAQTFGPVSHTHRVEALVGGDAVGTNDLVLEGRGVRVPDGRYPILGNPQAAHVMVELLDYPCPACRRMSGYVEALLAQYPNEVAVVVLPVPLDRTCHDLPHGSDEHPGACRMSKVAWAVWRSAPENFAEFHKALIDDPDPQLAEELAQALIGEERLAAALADPVADEVIAHNIRLWKRMSSQTRSLPKIWLGHDRVLHGVPVSQEAFLEMMRKEWGLE